MTNFRLGPDRLYVEPRNLTTGNSAPGKRFTYTGKKVVIPSQSTFSMIIKGSITQTWEGEWANDLLYKFQISPLAQDLQGNDRVFTFAYYTTKPKRATPKHSDERKLIARCLRKHHTLIWKRFHDAMDRP